MTDHAKTIVDLSSITVVLATLVEWLPCGGALAVSDLVGHTHLRNSNRAEVDREMSQAIVMSYGEVILLGVVIAGLLFAAFRK